MGFEPIVKKQAYQTKLINDFNTNIISPNFFKTLKN